LFYEIILKTTRTACFTGILYRRVHRGIKIHNQMSNQKDRQKKKKIRRNDWKQQHRFLTNTCNFCSKM